MSAEFFAPDGYITESIMYRATDGESREQAHWWFERGMHVKFIGSARNSSPRSPGLYLKDGDRWVKKRDLK